MTDSDYFEHIHKFREARDERFRINPQSWLTLVGLFHLEPGDNNFGADKVNRIVVETCAQAYCGSFYLENGSVTLKTLPDSSLTLNDQPPQERALHSDHDDAPDLIRVGSLLMIVLLRGKEHYLRVWDLQSPAILEFTGLKYFPIDPAYRIESRFIPYDPPRDIQIWDVVGAESSSQLAGEIHFTLEGVDCRLVAEDSGNELLFSFTDLTRADVTYPGGRFLTVEKPRDNRVVLDFNLAVNWPCAYTDFATCPLPPTENHLPVRIEAGEMRYRDH